MAFKFNDETPAKIIYKNNGVDQSVATVKYRYNNQDIVVWTAFESQEFSYKGSVETWRVPVTGIYELEVWGAQGGNYKETMNNVTTTGSGGKGGYSKARFRLQENQTLYIVIGGCPGENNKTGGYNGGATSTAPGTVSCGGGGATHIAIVNKGTDTSKGQLFNYENSASDDLLLVAGGGGGATFTGDGGSGGGDNGGSSKTVVSSNKTYYCGGGTQEGPGDSSAVYINVPQEDGHLELEMAIFKGSFGQGGKDSDLTDRFKTFGGGGGGYYGGSTYKYEDVFNTTTNHAVGGGGGSGYVNASKIVANSKDSQNGVNEGNGRAKITLKLD